MVRRVVCNKHWLLRSGLGLQSRERGHIGGRTKEEVAYDVGAGDDGSGGNGETGV